jgi:hypothetical protein
MKPKAFFVVLLLIVPAWMSACGALRGAPVAAEPLPAAEAPPPIPPFPHALAWTARADIAILTDEGERRIPHLFTRLNVLYPDTLGVRVQCLYCIPSLEGTVAREDVVYEALAPRVAAQHGLAELALAIRTAASERDEAALRPVMARDFSFSFEGGGGAVDAFQRWTWEGFGALDNLPPLLDRGLTTRDSVIWTAPPVFLTDPEYHGLRAGFRRTREGHWEWIYLIGR